MGQVLQASITHCPMAVRVFGWFRQIPRGLPRGASLFSTSTPLDGLPQSALPADVHGGV